MEIKLAVKKTCLLFIPSNFHTFFKVTRRDTQINSPERTMRRANRHSISFVLIFPVRGFEFITTIFFHVWNFEFHFAKKLMSTSAPDGSCEFIPIILSNARIFCDSHDFYIYGSLFFFYLFSSWIRCTSTTTYDGMEVDVGDERHHMTESQHLISARLATAATSQR